MSSNRKKAESIASSMMILVDFDGAMVTDVVLQCNRAAKGFIARLSPVSACGKSGVLYLGHQTHMTEVLWQ